MVYIQFARHIRRIIAATASIDRVVSRRICGYLGLLGCTSALWLDLNWLVAAHAQLNADADTPEICQVDLDLLRASERRKHPEIVTENTLSAQSMTVPSLWWAREQSPPQSITNWIADRDRQQIFLLVNNEYWNRLDYLGRYQTLIKFGRVARDYGYSLKICNSQKVVQARYLCEPKDSPIASLKISNDLERTEPQTSCKIWIDSTGKNGLGVIVK